MSAAVVPSDPLHLNLRKDMRSSGIGDGQIVRIQRVLCTHVAASDAISTVNARLLPDPPPVQAIDVEIHGNVGQVEIGFGDTLLTAFESSRLTQLAAQGV